LDKKIIVVCLLWCNFSYSKTIIVPLNQFLFSVDYPALKSYAGISWYTNVQSLLSGYFSTKSIIHCAMDILDEIDVEIESKQPVFWERKVPKIICQWLTSSRPIDDIHTDIAGIIEKTDRLGQWLKDIFLRVVNLLTDLDQGIQFIKPHPPGIELVRRLREEYCHTLILFCNCNPEVFTRLQTMYPEVFALFDGVHTSGTTKKIRPTFDAFDHLMYEFDLEPSECVYVATIEHGLKTGEELGMQVLLLPWGDCTHAMPQLQAMGAL